MSAPAFESCNNPVRSTCPGVACPPHRHRLTAANMRPRRPHIARSVTNSRGPSGSRFRNEICHSLAVILIIGIQDTSGSSIAHEQIGRPHETWAYIMPVRSGTIGSSRWLTATVDLNVYAGLSSGIFKNIMQFARNRLVASCMLLCFYDAATDVGGGAATS